MSGVRAELDRQGKRICVWFPYSPAAVQAVKDIPGRRFVPQDKGGPYWTVPLDLDSARALRTAFPQMVLGERVRAWGQQEVAKQRDLMKVAGADSAELERLPNEFPELHEFISGRPYQLADVAFLSKQNAINANQPSLGKTIETIASIWEAGLEDGPHLIVAPVSSLETVWEPEIRKHDGAEVILYQGSGRQVWLGRAMELAHEGEPFYMLTNPDLVRMDGERLAAIEWNTMTIDEYHKSGLSNEKTKFFDAAKRIPAKRKWALTGTPVGGKPVKLWAALHFLHPDVFTSKWRWVGQWLVVEDNGFGKKIGGIKPGLEDAFYQSLRPYLVRRTKAEVRKDLPEKVYIPVMCEMTPTQAKQYRQMAEETEVRIEEEHLSASNVLALYTRLKQFANARCTLVGGKVQPTFDSGKLPALLERLQERGIGLPDSIPEASVLIGTQFKAWAYAVQAWLEEQGVSNVGVISGDTKKADRLAMAGPEGAFQRGDMRVLILVTGAGGVALNLDRAESIHVLDETWSPDDQEQLEDRGHRFTGLTVYNYRSKGTIEQYIEDINIDKAAINASILDLRRQGVVRVV